MSLIKRLPAYTRALARNLGTTVEILDGGFTRCANEDLPAVSDLRRRVFGSRITNEDESYLRWRYFRGNSPASNLYCLKLNGRIIAAVGTEERQVRLQSHSLTCIKCADAIVEPEFDGRGIGAWINLKLMSTHELVIVIGGNKNSISLLRKLFTGLPVRHAYKYPVALGSILIARKGKFRVLAPFAGAINWISRSLVRMRLKLAQANNQISEFATIASLTENLSGQPTADTDNEIVRSKSYLNWRYSTDSGKQYCFFGAGLGTEAQAFVIAKIGYPNTPDIPVGLILDWGYTPNDQGLDTFEQLVGHVALQLVSKKVVFLQAIANDSQSIDVFTRLGFMHRGTDDRFFVYASSKEAQSALEPDLWFVCHGESDGV